MSADTIGGVWTYCMELARAIKDRADVVVAAMGGVATAEQRAEARDAGVELFNKPFKLEWMDKPWNDVLAAGGWMLDLEDRLQPNIVHLNNYALGSLPWRCPAIVVAHSCVYSWWEAVHHELPPEPYHLYRDAVRKGLYFADAVVAPTASMLSALDRFYGPLTNATVISNGIDMGFRRSSAKEPIIFSAGRLWDKAKNLQLLADISPRLPWPVYTAGDAKSPDGRDSPTGDIRFLGRLSRQQTAIWMGRSPIYALPAQYEPFGLSILEAALSGCALVIGDIDSLREVWSGAAIYVPPDDSLALELAINRLINDAVEREDVAARAFSRGLAYSSRRMADQYLAIYEELLCPASAKTLT